MSTSFAASQVAHYAAAASDQTSTRRARRRSAAALESWIRKLGEAHLAASTPAEVAAAALASAS